MAPSTNIIAKQTDKLPAKPRYTIVIPESYDPPNDLMARFANWAAKESALYPERMDFGYWIPLSREHGRKLFGGNWHKVIREALQTGLVVRHSSYSTGTKTNKPFPKAVCLAAKHRNGKFKQHQLIRKPQISANLQRFQAENLRPVGMWLKQWLPTFTLPADITPLSCWDGFILGSINSQNFYVKRCPYGRYHTPYTALRKQWRAKLTCTATTEPLVSIDIRQSQPTLLDTLIMTHTTTPTPLICDTTSDVYDLILHFSQGIEPFKAFCETGLEWINPATWTRDDAKTNLLKSIFARNNTMVKQPAFQALQHLLPAHAKYIREAKRANHAALAHRLQCLESQIVIDRTCGFLMRYYPNSPVQTVHDELIVPKSMEQVVARRLKAEFEKHGVSPSLRIQNLDASHPQA